MKFGNKACVAVTLGAALDLKDQVAKPYSPAIKRNLWAIGSAAGTADVRIAAAGSDHDSKHKRDFKPPEAKCAGAPEESLRMVMYLSCWGPN